MLFFFVGAGPGTFCMDCSTSSNTSCWTYLGLTAGFSIWWFGFSCRDCIVSSMARSKDDEVQVQYLLFFSNITALSEAVLKRAKLI